MAIPGYRILRKIRQGGMSTVYLAMQNSVEREVAIKVMSPSLNSDPSFSSRFLHEAKIVGQLSHPNIIAIYDVGSYQHFHYITMDYLPGGSLQDKLRQEANKPAVLSQKRINTAVNILLEIASALDYAHQQGYIHRDIKPDNILFRANGSAVLCDFGIAKSLKSDNHITHIGKVLGSPNYMSPEQAQGKALNNSADLYSLGVVFYEMLTGSVPFKADQPVAVAILHMTAAVPKLPTQLQHFQAIINKLLAKKVSRRFQSGAQIINALTQLQSNQGQGQGMDLSGHATTLQISGLTRALFSTLSHNIHLAIKRLMLSQLRLRSPTAVLSHQQRDDIDHFILQDPESGPDIGTDDDHKLFQDTLELAAIRKPPLALLSSLLLIALLIAGWQQSGPALLQWLDTSSSPPPVNRTLTAAVNQAQRLTAPADTRQPKVKSPAKDLLPAPAPSSDSTAVPSLAPKQWALNIEAVPNFARVRILNIKPKYQPGIALPAGKYQIEVNAKDYLPQRFWLTITDADIIRHISLQASRKLWPAGSQIIDQLVDGSPAPSMVLIAKGTLVLADGRRLVLEQALAVSQTEITFAQFDKFSQHQQIAPAKDYGWGRGSRPVVAISLATAKDYARWLSKQTGHRYRLPTHLEWEYAARGGNSAAYWWGEASAKKRANCRRGCNSEYSRLFSSSTAPVASYPANGFGLFDVAGNVAEWLDECKQWQSRDEQQCLQVVAAGGSHQDGAANIAHDQTVTINTKQDVSKAIGFRLVLEL